MSRKLALAGFAPPLVGIALILAAIFVGAWSSCLSRMKCENRAGPEDVLNVSCKTKTDRGHK